MQGEKVAVCWVPIDKTTKANGAMGYVKGSHRWGKLYQPSDFVTRNGVFAANNAKCSASSAGSRPNEPALEPLPPMEQHPSLGYFDADPGDVIVHHWATVHGSTGNVSSDPTAIRRAASIRFAGDGVRFYQRPSSPEPFRGAIVGLRDGDKLDNDPRFPVVWPRTGINTKTRARSRL
jgi:ectoine hydroxylase-related dioxygenase (phytanoyl-CoA dioxygenase family)